jgi:putative ABC transport system substrate-binding protein
MAVAGDAVATGLVASVVRPGGNVTGLSFFFPELAAKRLELLKEAVPKITRVAVLLNPGNPANGPVMKAMEPAAQLLKIELQQVEIRGPDELESAFPAMAKRRADALAIIDDAMFIAHARRIADLAVKNRMPSVGFKEHVAAGGLMGYGVNLSDLWRRAATYVDKILKGTKPADLPVEQPTRFELVINLKTAKALGLTLPQSILIRADQVIQ